MKSWPDRRSPWGRQVRFEESEFEAMMEEQLHRSAHGQPVAGTGVDIDKILLKGLGVEADYVALPRGVMGRTLFRRDGSFAVEVSRELADEAESDVVARRRLRSTLAHECGHICCHGVLHLCDTETIPLFPDAPATAEIPSVLCRREVIGDHRYNGEWWEYQANQCMACLLLPRRFITPAAMATLSTIGCGTFEQALIEGKGETLVRILADEFDVSQSVTLFRLQSLGFIPSNRATQLNALL